jgi:hypothetical protein
MRADNSRHIVEAAHRRRELTRSKALKALQELETINGTVTFEAVAKRAGVSRSWLYAQPDLRAHIEHLRATHNRAPNSPVPARQRASDASLLRRLETANERIRRLTQQNQQLREQLARALGEQRAAPTRPSRRKAPTAIPDR